MDTLLMEPRAVQIVRELVTALEKEWRENHKAFCLPNYPHAGECKYPRIKELKDWDESQSKCEFCGKSFVKEKPWQKYCHPNCTSAAYRKRKNPNAKTRDKKVVYE